jgi:hypothetical protein
MLRTILAALAALGVSAGAAGAQGAADVGEYHERFVDDADPRDRVTRSGVVAERRALAADPVIDQTVVISRSPVVVSRSPAAIADPAADDDRNTGAGEERAGRSPIR